MKLYKNRIILIVVILTAYIVSAAYFYASFGAGGSSAAFSSYNGNFDGGSLFYDTLYEMGYPVARYHSALTARCDAGAVQVIIEPGFYIADAEGPLEWVVGGGRLVWLDDMRRSFPRAGFRLEDIHGEFTVYRYGAGTIVTGPGGDLSNEALYTDAAAGYIMEHILSGWKTDIIYFNEYYHGYSAEPNLFKELPLYLQLLIIQLALIVFLYVWRLGKRFGKPVMYREETEREENEYILALAGIFEKNGKGRAVTDIYTRQFLNNCGARFDLQTDVNGRFDIRGLIIRWREENYPYADELADIFTTAETEYDAGTKRGGRRLTERVQSLKKLNGLVERGRVRPQESERI